MVSKLSKLFISNVRQILGDRSAYWLSKECGVSQAALSRIFSGEMKPSLETIELIANALSVTPASLISEEKPVIIEKNIKVQLESDQMAAIKKALNDIVDGERNHLAKIIWERIPGDIIESLLNGSHDWNLIRAALDLPEVNKSKKRKRKSVRSI